MSNQEEARKQKAAGKSLATIARDMGVSKSTVHRWTQEDAVQKGFLNPTWTEVGGNNHGPVDAFGAIDEPTFGELAKLCEDTVYTCAKWLSDTVSSVPLKVYVTTSPQQKSPRCPTRAVWKNVQLDHLPNVDVKEVLDHPLKELIDNPNSEMNRNEMLRIIDIDLSMTGNGFLYKMRENFKLGDEQDLNEGIVEELWPLPAQHMEIKYDAKNRGIGFIDNRTTPKFIPKADLVWFKNPDPRNPYGMGYGPVRGVYERVLQSKSELAYIAALFRNQARPDSLLLIPGISASEAERVQKEMTQRFRRGGIGGIYVPSGWSDEGGEFKPLGWSPKDMFTTDIYKYTKLQILNAFGLNPAIFDTESSNRAVADTARYMAMLNGVVPRLRLIEEKLNHQLAKSEFDDRFILIFDDCVPEDQEAKLKEQNDGLDRQVYTVNEVRGMRGLPPVAWGNEPIPKTPAPTAAASPQSGGSPKEM